MNPAFRLLLIVRAGYAAAVVAAPVMVLALQTLLASIEGTQPLVQWSGTPDYLMLGMTLTGTYAAMPFLVAIAVLRLPQHREWLTHALAGALTAQCAIFIASIGALEGVEMNLIPIFIAGTGAGYVYLLAIGASAGLRPERAALTCLRCRLYRCHVSGSRSRTRVAGRPATGRPAVHVRYLL